jgi:probable rRNA maturation factor
LTASLRFTLQIAAPVTDVPGRATLRRWAAAALDRDARVTLRLVGRREGKALNARFRGKDAPTNVLTFVYDDGVTLSGDIVICTPVVRREAREQGKTLKAHLAHLIVHGMLHLQGYDHQRAAEARRMERREVALLASLGIPDPYAVPS